MDILNAKTTALAIGSTSVLALLASSGASLAGDGLYMGFAAGSNSGENPSPGNSDSEDYEMGGRSVSAFIGVQKSMGTDMFGGIELAYTGSTQGDANNDASDDYAYDTNFTIDAKARVGKHFGKVDVYGFGGLTTGSTDKMYYGGEYSWTGLNLGAGAQYNVTESMFVGVEYIKRFTDGTYDDDVDYSASHSTLSLRVGYSF